MTNNVRNTNSSTILLFAIAAAMFVVLAAVGGFVTSHRINLTADEHAMSAGRPGDEKPNLTQEQSIGSSLRNSSTTGASSNSSVPPGFR